MFLLLRSLRRITIPTRVVKTLPFSREAAVSQGIISFPARLPSSQSQQRFMTTPSAERTLQAGLQNVRHDKWGWLIYRTTYADDGLWARLHKAIHEQSHRAITESDAPEIADSLEWTFVQDKRTLEGATRAELRSRFRAWASEAVVAENPRAAGAEPLYRRPAAQLTPRYRYFIQVDEEALREGHLNLVKADWEPDPEDHVGDYDAIEGYTGEDVGWFKMSSTMLGADLWGAINDETWHVYYRRPPGVLVS
ncbi:hypothetical protein GGR52DRAFT_189768 [Hypoxylon sp. FL1284]|nr:hypothetical protein GGR52DRAFT_189768 [Hypoxylon sp. FL1284]